MPAATPRPGSRLADAFAFAAEIHAHDTRKGGAIPYVSHLLIVSGLVLEDGGTEDEGMAALLHDAAEDHGGEPMLAEIAERFGPRVADVVRGCSDSLRAEGAVKEAWGPRKRRYLEHLRDTDDEGVLRVSCADKLHNARTVLEDFRDVGDDLWSRFSAGGEHQLWYYRELSAIFSARRPASTVTRALAGVVGALELEMDAAGAGSVGAG